MVSESKNGKKFNKSPKKTGNPSSGSKKKKSIKAKTGRTPPRSREHSKHIEISAKNAHYNLAISCFMAGDLKNAAASMKKAVKEHPSWPDQRNFLGRIYLAAGHYEDAIGQFEMAVELNSKFIDAHLNLGIAFDKLGLRIAAIGEYHEVLELEPDNEMALKCLKSDTHHDKIEIDQNPSPDFANIHANLGHSYFEQGLYDKAIEKYEQSIEINPNYADVHNQLANAYYIRKRFMLAIRGYKKALEINPDFLVARINLGIALYAAGEKKAARNEWIKAQDIDSSNQRIHELLSGNMPSKMLI